MCMLCLHSERSVLLLWFGDVMRSFCLFLAVVESINPLYFGGQMDSAMVLKIKEELSLFQYKQYFM